MHHFLLLLVLAITSGLLSALLFSVNAVQFLEAQKREEVRSRLGLAYWLGVVFGVLTVVVGRCALLELMPDHGVIAFCVAGACWVISNSFLTLGIFGPFFGAPSMQKTLQSVI